MPNAVFVLDTNRQPLQPVHPAVARKMLSTKQAAVFRTYPFTIICQAGISTGSVVPARLKIDPGSKTTGLVLLEDARVIWAAELTHRGHRISAALESRRSVRHGRRQRHTRYRPPRFNNRRRPPGWLPPSLMHRVHTTMTWVARLCRWAPVAAISVELARFDMQLMQDPEVSGVAYQQGELAGYEVREYLLEKWQWTCAYCKTKDVPLEVEHIIPKSRGGTHRVSNLTMACRPCNLVKGNRTAAEFGYPEVQATAKMPLKDAAAVNATRWRLWQELTTTGHPVETGTGGRTKYNRTRRGLSKAHWLDAACVGASTPEALVLRTNRPLRITSIGRGTRHVVRSDKYGFPRGSAGRVKRAYGFSTGDHVRLVQPRGKYTGNWAGILAGIRERGDHDIKTTCGKKITARWTNFRLVQRADGYVYA